MVTRIDIPDAIVDGIFSKANEQSAVATLARNVELLSPRDSIIYSFDGSPAHFHRAGDATDKVIDDDAVTSTDVPVRTLYKILEFPDDQYEDAEILEKLISQVVDKLPGLIAETYDKAVFGTTVLSDSPFPGFTGTPISLDATPDTWLDAINAVSANGYSPNGMILDQSFSGLLRSALVAGTTTNGLSVPVQDGISVAGVPAYFRDLGAEVGVVGDFRQAVVATYSDLTIELHEPSGALAQRRRNTYAVYAGLRVGFAVADQDAFQPVDQEVAEDAGD